MNEFTMSAQKLAIYGMGMFALWIVGIAITAIIWNLVGRWFRNGKGSNRKGDPPGHWTIELLLHARQTKDSIEDLTKFMKNGFCDNISKLTDVVEKCHAKHEKMEKAFYSASKSKDKDNHPF